MAWGGGGGGWRAAGEGYGLGRRVSGIVTWVEPGRDPRLNAISMNLFDRRVCYRTAESDPTTHKRGWQQQKSIHYQPFVPDEFIKPDAGTAI